MEKLKITALARITALALTLGLSSLAMADMNSATDILAKNPKASYDITTKSSQDPISIDVLINSKTVDTAQGTPEEFVQAMRAKTATRTIKAQEFTYQLEWEKISVPGEVNGLAVYDLLSDIKDYQSEPDDSTTEGYFNQITTPLSIVGPYVSYRSYGEGYAPGAAHPDSWDDFRAIDVSSLSSGATSYNAANLVDIVDEASLVSALQADKALGKLIQPSARKKFLAAKTLSQIADAASDLKSCYSFPAYENKLSAFAIYDYDAVKKLVSIRISMSAAAHVCAGEAPTIQLGLLVKPLQDLEVRLAGQIQSGEGLLMKNKLAARPVGPRR